ncbi:MAG: kelch repeat-containing protein [Planctomycetales bacterium]
MGISMRTVGLPGALSLAFALTCGPVADAEEKPDAARLPANEWVKLVEEETGGRNSPMFFYEPHLKKFILAGGTPGGGSANAKRHFEVEHFDVATRTWSNAYPDGARYKPNSGPTDAPVIGSDGLKSLVLEDKDGVTRLATFGSAYGTDTRAHFQWAYDSDSKKLFAHLWNETLAYDPQTRAWTKTDAKPFSKGRFPMVWGNMAYDSINKEILSIGGASEERGGTPGTHVFDIAKNEWRRIEPAKELMDRHERTQTARRAAWALVSACRSRYFVTETEAEARADLADAAVKAANLLGADGSLTEQFRLRGFASELDAAAKLDPPMTAEIIAHAKAAYDRAAETEVVFGAPDPPGRAHSQLAVDPQRGKIVLFGGNGLDRCYADTWIYDCKTRTWEQRFPKLSPSPRAPSPRGGHALAYLPKSGKIALAGGYTIDGGYKSIPFEVWIYDIDRNEWSLLTSLPESERGEPANAPRGGVGGNYAGAGSPWAGAVTPDDVLVMVDTFTAGRTTWACRIDPSQVDAEGTKERGVQPLTMSFAQQPAEWEKDAAPDPTAVRKFYDGLKPNVWTPLKPPKPVDHRAWNTTAYDPDRQQFLWWGGGHVTYMGTDVAHYSVRANRWTIGYPPDLATEPTGGFYVKAALSFQDRPQIPVHAYQAYAYDPPSGKMFYLDRAYDVASRQWDVDPYPGLEHRGVMHTLLASTPHGVVALSDRGLFRFDAKEKAWKKLPWKSTGERVWCDGNGLVYDSKRDCLWYATGDIYKYDFKTGTVEKLDVRRPKRLGEWALWREQAYLPEADLILLMQQFKGPDGKEVNVAFDPAARKYYTVALEGSPRADRWTAALHYDPKLGVALLHDGRSEVWALQFDRNSARMREISD